jgi:hypothetical protein
VWHAEQKHAGGERIYPPPSWTEWQSLDRPGRKDVISKPHGGKPTDPTPVLTANADGRLEVFVIRNDLTVWHRWQRQERTWSDWAPLQRPGEGTLGPLAIAANDDGRLELFANDLHGVIWHCWQIEPNGGWSGWQSLGTPGHHPARSGPVPVSGQDGDLRLFAVAEDGALRYCWQIRDSSSPNDYRWSGWDSLGSQGSGLAEVAVAADAKGRLVLFATEPENSSDL